MKRIAIATVVVIFWSGGLVAARTIGQDHPSAEATKGQTVKRPSLPGSVHGYGVKDLGTVRVARAELVWTTCAGCKVTISNSPRDPSQIRVNPRDRGKGYAFVAAGTYHHLTVHGASAWTVRFKQALLLK